MTATRPLWMPGAGMDRDSLARIVAGCPRPDSPCSWDTWQREAPADFPDPSAGDHEALCDLLFSAREGLRFGNVRIEWFHYFLASALERIERGGACDLFALAVGGFITAHWHRVQDPYPGFRDDVLRTLGVVLFEAHLWDGPAHAMGDLALGVNERRFAQGVEAASWSSPGHEDALGAAICLRLKYLPPAAMEEWVRSYLAIRAPRFRMLLLAWYVSAWPTVRAGRIREALGDWGSGFGWGEFVGPPYGEPPTPFADDAHIDAFVAANRSLMTLEVLVELTSTLKRDPVFNQVIVSRNWETRILEVLEP